MSAESFLGDVSEPSTIILGRGYSRSESLSLSKDGKTDVMAEAAALTFLIYDIILTFDEEVIEK